MRAPFFLDRLICPTTLIAVVVVLTAVACGNDSAPKEVEEQKPLIESDELEPGQPPPGVVGRDGDGNVNGENGAPSPGENSDADGYCFDPEIGYYECDDGAPPGTGVDGFEDPTGHGPGGDGDGSGGDGDGPGGDGDGPGGDGPGNGGDGDGDGPGPGGGGAICTQEVFANAGDTPARILLVVDKSGSMDDDAVGYAGSKWEGAIAALSSVVQSTENSIAYGLMQYPAGDANNAVCSEGSLNVAVEVGNADNIVDDLQGSSPGGGTPTAATLQQARTVLDALGTEGGNRAVVLATDGGPNCNTNLNVNTCQCMNDNGCDDARNCLDDNNTITAAQQLSDAGYSVFVIGIPGSENYTSVLNELAEAGGTALPGATSYYDATGSDALAESLADIITRVATCRFDLANIPLGSALDVSVGGTSVSQDPTRTNGWDLVDNNTVELFGITCNLALGSGVEIEVGYCYTPDA